MDEETAELILNLQIEDAHNYRSSQKGKQKEGETSDLDLAVQSQEAEFEQAASLLSDRRMCRSMNRAIQDDGAVLSMARAEECLARRDHDLACSLAGDSAPTSAAEASTMKIPLTETLLSRFSCMNISPQDDDVSSLVTYSEHDPGEGPSKANHFNAHESVECTSCLENKANHEILLLHCGHTYCRPCVVQLFELSMDDESLFPPRCCGLPIARSAVQGLVGPQLLHRAERKDVERATTNRTYCSNVNCSTFILPEDIHGKQVTCTECGEITCVECKKTAHEGPCVLVDEGKEELLRVAREEGWRECPGCKNMVELRLGCNHIM